MAGAPPPPPGFVLEEDAPRKVDPAVSSALAATGEVHDGDTFRLSEGSNARLFGVDAFELKQPGYRPTGPYALGGASRDVLASLINPDVEVSATGGQTYGRPVVTAGGDNDVARVLLDKGVALAAPEYLKGDPLRLREYMEAERFARLNRHGAHAGKFQTPGDYRHGVPDPWAKPEEGQYGNSIAVMWDEPLPQQGLRPEIEQGYLAIAKDPKATAAELLAYAKANGFEIDPAEAAAFIENRNKGVGVREQVGYRTPPRVLTDPGDGVTGAALRGAADPINMLDEIGAVVDTLGGSSGRENVWSSDRRFGDILHNNLDQNRSIVGFDEANNPYWRMGGQFASGVALPGASIEGVGLAAARKVLQEGGSRFMAEAAAKAAVRGRLAIAGSVEGGLAGFGGAEGDMVDRLPQAALGAGTGALLGYGTAAAGQAILPRLTGRARKATEIGGEQAEGAGIDQVNASAPKPPAGFVLDMTADIEPLPSITSPRPAPVNEAYNSARPMTQPPTEAQMRAAGERVNPSDILPIPASAVDGVEEAAAIGAGRYASVKAVDESKALESRSIPSSSDPSKTIAKRGPLDLVTWARAQGGIRDDSGELAHMGIDNRGRDLDFAKGEQRLGRLIDDNGMSLDDAARRAWEEGYFPDRPERPTINDFLDALDNTHRGSNRVFRPDDTGEIDRFYSARDQRQSVEQAELDGIDLVHDRSQPATEDDVAANAAPVSAHEDWPAGGPDFAGNIRLEKLDTPQDIKRALVQTEKRVGFDAATRGRVTQAETARLASEMGMTADKLLSRRKGQALNAEEALAARQILAKSGNELVNVAKRVKAAGEEPGSEILAQFRQAWMRHAAIQEQVAGMTAEAGRALQQFRMTADSGAVPGHVLKGLVDAGGGSNRLIEAADAIVDLEKQPGKMNAWALKAANPRWKDKLTELWINSLLSGPQTHVVNMMSNTMTALAQIPEHAAAAAVGGVRSLVSRRPVDDRVLFSELGARSVGLLQGVKEGLRQMVRTARTGEASDFAGKLDTPDMQAISGLKGKIIRTPTRLLSAEDELFKGMARRMELSGLAVREAGKEGLTGEPAKRRAAELLADPTDDMLDKAFDYGRYVTFQRPLGPIASHVAAATQAVPIPLKFIVPFVRTPANLLKFALERSPVAPLIDTWRKDFTAGGARRDLAIARALVGSGLGAVVAELAAQGHITGNGPADDSAKAILRADGWQPYSIMIGDTYYSYSRMDPFSTTLGVAADMVELQEHMTEKQQENVAALVTASVMQNLSNKTWLSGISDLNDAIKDPQRSAGSFLKRLAGSVAVPTGVAQVARTIDPTMREAQGILDAVRARVPFASKDLFPVRDIWGLPVTGEGSVGPDIVSPIWQSTRERDPVAEALLDADIHVGKPSRTVGGRRLSAEEWDKYQEVAGALIHSGIADAVKASGWKALPPDEKQDAVDKIAAALRKGAREAVLGDQSSVAAALMPPPGYKVDAPPAGFVVDR